MRGIVLVDTGGIVGFYVGTDERHRPAVRTFEELRDAGRRLLCTSDIFDETVTLVARRSGHWNAVRVGEEILDGGMFELAEVDAGVRREAWRVFRKYGEHGLSFTDCSSVAVMRKYGTNEILTFDKGFRKVGLVCLPGRF